MLHMHDWTQRKVEWKLLPVALRLYARIERKRRSCRRTTAAHVTSTNERHISERMRKAAKGLATIIQHELCTRPSGKRKSQHWLMCGIISPFHFAAWMVRRRFFPRKLFRHSPAKLGLLAWNWIKATAGNGSVFAFVGKTFISLNQTRDIGFSYLKGLTFWWFWFRNWQFNLYESNGW